MNDWGYLIGAILAGAGAVWAFMRGAKMSLWSHYCIELDGGEAELEKGKACPFCGAKEQEVWGE